MIDKQMKTTGDFWRIIRHIGYIVAFLGSIYVLRVLVSAERLDLTLFIWALLVAFASLSMLVIDR